MNFIKRAVIASTVIVGCAAAANAQYFDKLGLSAGVGTNGITFEASTRITNFVNMRAGIDIMPGFSFTSDADFTYSYGDPTLGQGYYDGSIDLKGDLGRTQGHVIFNVYPIPKVGFYLAAGAYFGGNKLVKIKGHSDDLNQALINDGYVVIGDYTIPVDPNGNVSGGLKIKGFRPYLGIGWGRAIPGKLLSFGIDLGVQFEGTPEVYTDYGEIDLSEIDDDNTFNKIRDALKVYPTLTFKLNFRVL